MERLADTVNRLDQIFYLAAFFCRGGENIFLIAMRVHDGSGVFGQDLIYIRFDLENPHFPLVVHSRYDPGRAQFFSKEAVIKKYSRQLKFRAMGQGQHDGIHLDFGPRPEVAGDQMADLYLLVDSHVMNREPVKNLCQARRIDMLTTTKNRGILKTVNCRSPLIINTIKAAE